MDAGFPELSEDALYGLPGDVVRAILPHSEADPAALLVQTLVFFGNCIGRTAHFVAEDDKHYLNLYALMIGDTSKSRKGTSLGRVRRIFRDVDEHWSKNRVRSGLSSGEGLVFAVSDGDGLSITIEDKDGTTSDSAKDKRLLVLESEFSSVLGVMSRQGNTLSAVIREAWDTGDLNVITKNSPLRATDAHISIIGHITSEELLRRLSGVDIANGFANRFLFAHTRRRQLLPEGGRLDDETCGSFAEQLRAAIQAAQLVCEMKRDQEATTLWYMIYRDLSEGSSGLVGAVTSRAEAQVMRLACVYALMDGSSVVKRAHLEAAYALWQYCEASAHYIFGEATGDQMVDEILEALKTAGSDGLTQSEINNLLSGHKSSNRISDALLGLSKRGIVTSHSEKTGGRPAQRWFFVAEKAEKAEERPASRTYSASSACDHNGSPDGGADSASLKEPQAVTDIFLCGQ